FLVAVLHDLSECARLFGRPVDPPQTQGLFSPQRRRERGGISRLKGLRLTGFRKYLKAFSLIVYLETVSQKFPICFQGVSICFHMFPWQRKGLRASAGAASQKIGRELEAFNALPRCYPRTRTKRGFS